MANGAVVGCHSVSRRVTMLTVSRSSEERTLLSSLPYSSVLLASQMMVATAPFTGCAVMESFWQTRCSQLQAGSGVYLNGIQQ